MYGLFQYLGSRCMVCFSISGLDVWSVSVSGVKMNGLFQYLGSR